MLFIPSSYLLSSSSIFFPLLSSVFPLYFILSHHYLFPFLSFVFSPLFSFFHSFSSFPILSIAFPCSPSSSYFVFYSILSSVPCLPSPSFPFPSIFSVMPFIFFPFPFLRSQIFSIKLQFLCFLFPFSYIQSFHPISSHLFPYLPRPTLPFFSFPSSFSSHFISSLSFPSHIFPSHLSLCPPFPSLPSPFPSLLFPSPAKPRAQDTHGYSNAATLIPGRVLAKYTVA